MSEINIDQMQEMLKQVIAQNNQLSGSRRNRGPDVKIKSVLVPVKITDRRETCRLYLECEAEANSPEDVLDILFQVEDAGFEVSWWQQKQDYNSRGRR